MCTHVSALCQPALTPLHLCASRYLDVIFLHQCLIISRHRFWQTVRLGGPIQRTPGWLGGPVLSKLPPSPTQLEKSSRKSKAVVVILNTWHHSKCCDGVDGGRKLVELEEEGDNFGVSGWLPPPPVPICHLYKPND